MCSCTPRAAQMRSLLPHRVLLSEDAGFRRCARTCYVPTPDVCATTACCRAEVGKDGGAGQTNAAPGGCVASTSCMRRKRMCMCSWCMRARSCCHLPRQHALLQWEPGDRGVRTGMLAQTLLPLYSTRAQPRLHKGLHFFTVGRTQEAAYARTAHLARESRRREVGLRRPPKAAVDAEGLGSTAAHLHVFCRAWGVRSRRGHQCLKADALLARCGQRYMGALAHIAEHPPASHHVAVAERASLDRDKNCVLLQTLLEVTARSTCQASWTGIWHPLPGPFRVLRVHLVNALAAATWALATPFQPHCPPYFIQ